MRTTKQAMRLAAILTAVAPLAMVQCANDYSCYDDRDCAPTGVAEGGSDGRSDARQDGGADAKKPDGGHPGEGGADGTTDAPATEGGRADGESDAPGDATGEGSTDAPPDVAVCNLKESLSAEPCQISEEYGVFVAPVNKGGSDSNPGTRAKPFATISHALANLGTTSRVYVCNGAYSDQITVTGAVSILGGLTCGDLKEGGAGDAGGADAGVTDAGGDAGEPTWTYVAGTTGTVAGASPEFTLKINAGSAAVDVEDLEFDAAAGTQASPSSIAVFAVSSSAVTMRRVVLFAAAGAAGMNGAPGAGGMLVSASVGGVAEATPSLNGQAAGGLMGGGATTCTCAVAGTTVGGAGGADIAGDDPNGTDGLPAMTSPSPAGATGDGATAIQCGGSPALGGYNGSDAVPSKAGDGSTASRGLLSAAGWVPGSGGVGSDGADGQGGGGGGGGGATMTGGGGGGGGCGGCGGSGGGFGTGGGASIALVAFDSPVALFSSSASTATAGSGGSGAAGGPGETGGTGGNRTMQGCVGGNGGTGSTGGAGSGGAGGVSIAILYSGSAPVPDGATTLTPGAFGAGGAGGNPGNNDGPTGVSATVQNASAL